MPPSPIAATERLHAILQASGDRDAQLWALLELFEDSLALPLSADTAAGRVELRHVDYGGDPEQGLIAGLSTPDGSQSLPLSAITLPTHVPGASLVSAYTTWFHAPASRTGNDADRGPVDPLDDGLVKLLVLAVLPRAVRGRRLDDGAEVAFRPADHDRVAPGTTLTIRRRPGVSHLEGDILDVAVLPEALAPWAPALVPIGHALFALDLAPAPDALDDAALLADSGDPQGAQRLLYELLAESPGLIAAHAALGDLELERQPAVALAHYAVGAALGDLAVPEPFDGLLPWEHDANRSFLTCLYGCGSALLRLGRVGEAHAPLKRLLALDPADALGAARLFGPPPAPLRR